MDDNLKKRSVGDLRLGSLNDHTSLQKYDFGSSEFKGIFNSDRSQEIQY